MRKQIFANSIETLSPYIKSGYDCFFLLKFFSTYEYQQEFLNGKLFFNTSDYFMMCDKKGQGDSSEGAAWKINPFNDGFKSANLKLIDGKTFIEVDDYSDEKENYKKGNIFSYSPAINRNRKIISFYTLYANSKEDILQSPPDDMDSVFGEYGVIILDVIELYKRIIDTIKKHSEIHSAQLGYVDYYENDEEEQGIIEYNPFLKPKDYSDQNEFRVTFINNTREPVKLDVGDIHDIASPIYKDGINDMYMKDGLLYYPQYIINA